MTVAELGGKPLKFKTPEELQEKIKEYFKYCDNTVVRTVFNKEGDIVQTITIPYTVTGLVSFLDTNKQTLLEYQGTVEGREKIDYRYADIIKNAKAKIEAGYEIKALTGESNAVFTIFALKNHYGWKDRTDTEQIAESFGALLQLWGAMDQKKEQIESQKATIDVILPKSLTENE